MDIKYLCPYWGCEDMRPADFFEAVLIEGYDGIEMNIPEEEGFSGGFTKALANAREHRADFGFVAQCVPDARKESNEEHIKRILKRLEFLAGFNPDMINSHTGKDYCSFDDNCRIIEAIENFSSQRGISVVHETHRGRFSFHGPTLLPYLERFPQMQIAADYSHWCTVSESMLEGQGWILHEMLPHVAHIHARIGHAQGPQVNDPFAPEWQGQMERFIGWWKDILHYKKGKGLQEFTITPEFGPAPYMPAAPFTCEPLGNQWLINSKMKEHLKINLCI